MKILAVSGSLRADSHNTQLLRAAREAAPEGVEVELWDGVRDLPLYDQDLENSRSRSRFAGSGRTGARPTRSSSRRRSTTARFPAC